MRLLCVYPNAGILKLCTSTFLMYFEFLNLHFVNQIWKSMYRYYGKFSSNFPKFDLFFVLWIFFYIKIVRTLAKKFKNHCCNTFCIYSGRSLHYGWRVEAKWTSQQWISKSFWCVPASRISEASSEWRFSSTFAQWCAWRLVWPEFYTLWWSELRIKLFYIVWVRSEDF